MAENNQNDRQKQGIARSYVSRSDASMMNLFFGTTERTFHESAQWPDSLLKPWNPDDIFQKNEAYDTYEEMLLDDQVHAAAQLKKDLVIGTGWDIVIDAEGMEDLREDLVIKLEEEVDRPLVEMFEEILTAYDFGFSISEKLWRKKKDGSVCLRDIKARHPATWRLEQDVYGNVSEYIQQSTPNGDIKIDPRTLIHYVNRPRFQNVYGHSDLRPAFPAYFAKRHVVRYQAIFLEKHASPMPYAQYDPDMNKEAVDDMFTALKRIQAATAMVIPKGIDLDFLQTSNSGEAYLKAIDLFNLMIGRAIMLPDLIGFTGSKTSGGSFALGSSQIEVAFRHIERRRQVLEDIVNQHIIKPLVNVNYGLIDSFPKFRFSPITKDDEQELAKLWLEGVRIRAWKPNPEEINHYRSITKFPEGNVEEAPAPAMPPGIGGSPAAPQAQGEQAQEIEEEGEAEEQEESVEIEGSAAREFSLADPDKQIFKPTEGDFHKRVDFKAAKNSLEMTISQIMAQAEPIQRLIVEDILRQIEKRNLLNPKNAEKLNSLRVPKQKDLQAILRKELREGYKRGNLQAQTELLNGATKANFRAPLVAEEFLDILEQETFRFVGDYAYKVSQVSRDALIAGMKEGLPLAAVQDMLELELMRLGRVSVERWGRTKATEVFNKGRHEFFESSNMVAGYQYSAILDGRTTDICAGLHGKKFIAGKEPIPPMHFNCRSLLIPITIYEDFEADKTPNATNALDEPVRYPVRDKDGRVTGYRSAGKVDINTFIEAAKGPGFAGK